MTLFALDPTALSLEQARERLAAEWGQRAPGSAEEVADFHRTSQATVEEIEAVHRDPDRQRRTEIITNVARQIGARAVLDVGCGAGHDLRALAGADRELWGVEPNERMRAGWLADRAVGVPDVADAPVERMDLVLCLDVLPRVPNAAVWLTSWVSRMRPGAVLIETCPSHDVWLPLTLPENHAWLPGPTLEGLGFVLLNEIEGMRLWQRAAEAGAARASLLLCAYRDVSPQTLAAVMALRDRGWRYLAKYGDALIDRSRSMAVSQWFRQTNDDVFLMIDNDITFTPEAGELLVERCRSGMDVVGGPYPARDGGHVILRGAEGALAGPDLYGPALEPMETNHVGTGFMAVHRRVIAALVETLPLCHTNQPWAFWPMFQPYSVEDVFAGGWNYLSEDYAFCERVRALGFRVWTDRTIRLGHLSQIEVTLDNMDLIREAVRGR